MRWRPSRKGGRDSVGPSGCGKTTLLMGLITVLVTALVGCRSRIRPPRHTKRIGPRQGEKSCLLLVVCLAGLCSIPVSPGASVGGEAPMVPDLVMGLGTLQLAALDPGGGYLATCSDSYIHLWDVEGGLVSSLPVLGDWPWAGLAWYPNGSMIAATDYRGTIRLLAPPNLSVVGELDHEYGNYHSMLTGIEPWPLCFSPDGSMLAIGFLSNAHVYDLETTRHLATLKGNADLNSLDWSPDGHSLLRNERTSMLVYNASTYLLEEDRQLRRWELRFALDQEEEQCYHAGFALFSPNGGMIASMHKRQNWTDLGSGVFRAGYSPVFLNIHDAETGARMVSIELEGDKWPDTAPTGLAWSPGSAFVAAGTPTGRILVIRREDGTVVSDTEAHPKAILSLSWQGSYLASTSEDRTTKLWEVDGSGSLSLSRSLGGWSAGIRMADWYPDGQQILAQYDGWWRTVSVFGLDGRETIRIQGAHGQPAVSADGRMIATSTKNGEVTVWDARFGTPAISFQATIGPETCRWNPVRPNILALAGHDGAEIWDVYSPEKGPVTRLAVGRDVGSLAWSPRGDLLALGSLTDIEIWDPERPSTVCDVTPNGCEVSSVAWSPDGLKLGCITLCGLLDSELVVWEIGGMDGELSLDVLARRKAPFQYLGASGLLAWAANSSMLAGATTNLGVLVWDLSTLQGAEGAKTPRVVLNLTDPMRGVSSVSWSPDGSRILTAAGDGNLRVWRVGPPTTPVGEALPGKSIWSVVLLAVSVLFRRPPDPPSPSCQQE